jgi:hypothetical protein
MMSRISFTFNHLSNLRCSHTLQTAIMGGGEHIPINNSTLQTDPGQNVYLHAVVDLGR